jgi:hypothetical protein
MKKRHAIATTAALVTACAAVLIASCKSTAPAAALAPAAPWRDMGHEERLAHMKRVVLPGMKIEFAAFDAGEFGDMDCTTCHGYGAEDGSFRMPNPDLPRLPGSPDGFERLLADEPKMTAFMVNVVVPKMAAMLGEPPYDPQKHAGFGCFRCHTTK